MNLVAIDILTTGGDARCDEIFEVAAVEIVNGRIGESFSGIADPGVDVPLQVRKSAGITQEQIDAAPPLSSILKKLVAFIGDRQCIAHDFRIKGKILENQTYGQFKKEIIDTLELARILLPTEERHDLEHYAQKYNFEPVEPHRASVYAMLTARLWHVLMAEMDQLPLPVLDTIMGLVEPVDWHLKPLFQKAHAAKFAEAFGKGSRRLISCLPDFSEVINEAADRKTERNRAKIDGEEPEAAFPLDIPEIINMFGPEGVFAKHLPNFTPRREQARMAKAVSYCFNNSHHLMVEAGTGTGKSLAYLIPAIYWGARNKMPVVISTYTKALQAQLYHKDIPMLTEMLDQSFRAAQIKGRANYLCPRKMMYVLAEAEREISEADRLALLPIVTWAALTQTGDIAENSGFQVARSVEIWDRLYATGDECRGRACDYWKCCFLLSARAQAQLSDIVVANHAVVFSEMGMLQASVLPEHKHLIFDEAHNVEGAATDCLGCEIDRRTVLRVLGRLYKQRGRDNTGRGLLTNILHHLRTGREMNPTDIEKIVIEKLISSFDLIADVEPQLDEFLRAFAVLFKPLDGEGRQRYSCESQPADKWENIKDQKEGFVAALAEVVKTLDFVLEQMDEIEREFAYQQDFMHQLESQLNQLREIIDNASFLMKADDARYVYWVECIDYFQGNFRVAAAPIEVGALLKDLLYEKRDTIVFSSATLSVADSFHFFRSRMGLDQLEPGKVLELSLGTSFDFQKQVLFCVPNFLPEPTYQNSSDFIRAMAEFLVELHIATNGRGLILFTSYDMLDKVYKELKDDLERENIVVLGQGIDAAPDQLLKTFRRVLESVLLGTQSFWEGVDVPGQSLSCLTLTKLPFAVFTDPIVKARCEAVEAKGGSSFLDYSVPTAVIRFKQGFGRLIRSHEDRGIVIMLDKRIITRRYGGYFFDSVPVKHKVYADKQKLLQDAATFLAIQKDETTEKKKLRE